jgi:hypothetical protein
MLHGNTGTGSYLPHSKERISQEGNLLSMFVYGINILPLICQLKVEFPSMVQPLYVRGGCSSSYWWWQIYWHTPVFTTRQEEIGSNFGYYPKPLKSILLLMHQHNLEAAQITFPDVIFKSHYGKLLHLGGLIVGEEDNAHREWL